MVVDYAKAGVIIAFGALVVGVVVAQYMKDQPKRAYQWIAAI